MLAEGEDGVVAAETEAVAERHPDRRAARRVRYEVEVARRVGALVVDGRRHGIVAQREHRDRRLDRSRSAEAMAGRAFRRRDGNRARLLLAERELDGGALRSEEHT